nr:NAD(P)H-quinone oxidoreductase subunit 4L [Anathallis microphyta]
MMLEHELFLSVY